MTHNLKLCANVSLLFNEYTLTDRLAAAADCGFRAVEIQFPYEAPLAALKQAQKEHRLRIPLINVPAGDLMEGGEGLACVPKHKDAFKRALDDCVTYAESLGVENVNVLAGRCHEESEYDRYFDTFLHNLDYAADQLQSIGVGTLFEAINTFDMPQFVVHSVAQMQQVLSDLNHSNVAMQYDIYHMSRMGEPVAQQLDSMLKDIGHIQFADTPHRHEPGTGDLDFPNLLGLLIKQNYSGWLGAEYKPSGTTENTLSWMEELGFNIT